MSTSTVIKSVALFFCQGNSDKEYNASIEQQGDKYVVNFAYGRRGNATSTGTKTNTPVSLDEAEKIYNKLIGEKTAKGYVPDGNATPFSGVDTAGRVTGLLPMLLNPIEESELEFYIDNLQWMMQEKLDGKRILCRIENGQATFSNRKGLSVGVPAEIEHQMSTLRDMVVDGELVGNKYILFDLLEYDGVDRRHVDAILRFEQLGEVTMPRQNIDIVSTAFMPEQKRALVESLRHKEGVVVKDIYGAYTAGRPNSGGLALKCKFWSSATCRVSSVNAKRSVNLEMADGAGVGKVTIPANYEIPSAGDLVEIKYLYFYANGALYQPIYLGARDDVACDTVASLKVKSEDSDED